MPSNRSELLLSHLWAENASDPPDGNSPTVGVTYRNSDMTETEFHDAWKYNTIVPSHTTNEIIYRLSKLTQLLETWGSLPWSSAVTYSIGAMVLASDNEIYISLTNTNINNDPTTSATNWRQLIRKATDLLVGTVHAYAGSIVPTGWLECNGAAVSRTTYASLFTAIGTAYGVGDNSTTFNLPDLRGYFIRGAGTNSDGTAAGTTGVKQADMVGPHVHQICDQSGPPSTNNVSPNYISTGITDDITGALLSDNNSGTETRPRNIPMLYIIKY